MNESKFSNWKVVKVENEFLYSNCCKKNQRIQSKRMDRRNAAGINYLNNMLMNRDYVSRLIGGCGIKTVFSLEELGEILSERVFAGLKFGGREKHFNEEVPAIFIDTPVMGMLVLLTGYGPDSKDSGYTLQILQWGDFDRYLGRINARANSVDLSEYLYLLVSEAIRDKVEIEIQRN